MSAVAGALESPGVLVGVGIDVVDIERFGRALGRRPALADRLFSQAERAEVAASGDPVAASAAHFAAKEAVMKALGAGLWSFPLRDVEVAGAAELRLGPGAAERAEHLGVTGWHLSLAIEGPVAMAVVLAGGPGVPAGSKSP